MLFPGDTAEKTARQPGTAYFCTSFPGQLTVDLRLFAGKSPYIEQTKPFARYLISGIKPNDRRYNAIQLDLKVDPDGRVVPAATEVATKTPLKVEKYGRSAISRLQKQGIIGKYQPASEPPYAGMIPANPNL